MRCLEFHDEPRDDRVMATSLEDQGHEAIAKAVASCKPPVVVVEMFRQFGDILHSTLVVRHIRSTERVSVVWAICKKFVPSFEAFTLEQHGPHAFAPLPELPPYPADGPVRVAWVKRARTLPGVARAVGCGVHPWGWPAGSIVDAVLINGGVKGLVVQRRPWLPLTQDDLTWADNFIEAHQLKQFVTLEYLSYSLATPSDAWFAALLKHLPFPVVSIAGASEPFMPGTIDGRGITFRQAKALIRRSSCFLGVGSGLTVVAASNGCEQPVVEMTTPELSMPNIGYRRVIPASTTPAVAGTKVETDSTVVAGKKIGEGLGTPVAGTKVQRGKHVEAGASAPGDLVVVRGNYRNVHGGTPHAVAQAVRSLIG